MIKSFEQYTNGCKCGGNCQCNKATNEAKKYKFKDLAKAWQHVYGEDMEDEYPAIYQEVTGAYKNKVTKSDLADIWNKVYGEDVADEYDGFFNSLKENLEEAEALDGFNSIDEDKSVVTEGKYEDMLDQGDGHVHFIVGDEAAAERLADAIEAKDLGDCDFYPEDGKIYLRVSFSVGYGGKEVANLKKVEKLVGMKAKAGSPEVWAADESIISEAIVKLPDLDLNRFQKNKFKKHLAKHRVKVEHVKFDATGKAELTYSAESKDDLLCLFKANGGYYQDAFIQRIEESLEESERKFKKGDKIEYKQLVGMGSKQDWSTLTGVVMKVKNKRKSPLGTLAPHQELTLKSGAVVSPFKNHKDIKLIDEANADGTISTDEDDLRDKLLLETELAITEFLDALKEKSYEIGGKFRGPGILAENMKIVQDKVKRFK